MKKTKLALTLKIKLFPNDKQKVLMKETMEAFIIMLI